MSREEVTQMSAEQIELFASTVADASSALEEIDPKIAERIRADQEDVAEINRNAQINPDLRSIKVVGRVGLTL